MDHPITTRLVAPLTHARLISRTYGLHRSEPLESGHHKGAQHKKSVLNYWRRRRCKKGYEFSHEYNEMKQELDKRASDSP